MYMCNLQRCGSTFASDHRDWYSFFGKHGTCKYVLYIQLHTFLDCLWSWAGRPRVGLWSVIMKFPIIITCICPMSSLYCVACADPDGERAYGPDPPPPWKITIMQGFLHVAILVRIPCKTTKLPSQHSMLGHHRPSSETPFKWRFAGGPMMAHV